MISDEIRSILEDLLWQAYMLGIELEEIDHLWEVFKSLK